MIKELTDMREFLIATVEENRLLKAKVEKFKKAFED
jgi:regulator of replication initiation timing